jgi:hypothetical protein
MPNPQMNPEFRADGGGFRSFRKVRTRLQATASVLNPALGESRKGRAPGVSHDPVPLVVGRRLSLATFYGHTSFGPKSIPSTSNTIENDMQIACRILYLFALYNYRPVFLSKIYDRIFRLALDDFRLKASIRETAKHCRLWEWMMSEPELQSAAP